VNENTRMLRVKRMRFIIELIKKVLGSNKTALIKLDYGQS
jgi:hypothetical protein